MSPSLKILRAAYASIQDGGRFGFEAIGVGRAGFSDARHAELANLLAGNPAQAALVEIFAGAFEVEFLRDIDFATAGAVCELRLDGILVQAGARVRAKRGQRLVLKQVHAGRILYLALTGGIEIPAVLGSSATDLVSAFGGFDGRLLRALDVLSTALEKNSLPIFRAWLVPYLPDHTPLRVMLAHDCPQTLAQQFFESHWRVSAQSQRSGMRLENAATKTMNPPDHDGVSRGVVPGVIQLPPNGLPIVLGVDAQTVGGYFVLGVVIAVDLWRIGQAVPGQIVRFQSVKIEQARALSQEQRFVRAKLELAISARTMDAGGAFTSATR